MNNFNQIPYPIQPNILPKQQVIQVNGKQSVDSIQMAPNSSVLLLDTSAPIIWLCTSDGVGRVTSIPYDIALHEEIPPINMNDLEERISNLEKLLEESRSKNESYATKPASKQNNRPKSN